MFIAKSLIFYPGLHVENYQELSDEIIIPAYHLNKLMEEFEDDERLYINLINTENNLEYLVAVGSPHNYDKNTIYVPQWILNLIECPGNNDTVIKIKKANIESIPVAKKIIIKPLDPIAFDIDTLDCFQKTLINLHSIKEKIIIPVNVPEIDPEFVMYAYIEKVEPAPISRILEGEVDVEFINEFEEVTDKSLPIISPIISPVSNNFGDSMIPEISPIVESASNTVILPELSNEEKRIQMREARLKRFQNNAK